MYYLLSLKHTEEDDDYMTFWKPNNGGYALTKKNFGIYEEIEKGYHDSDSTKPIPIELVNDLAKSILHENKECFVIRNTFSNHRRLGVNFIRGRLLKEDEWDEKEEKLEALKNRIEAHVKKGLQVFFSTEYGDIKIEEVQRIYHEFFVFDKSGNRFVMKEEKFLYGPFDFKIK